LTLRETYALNRLSSFKNLRRKGGKFDHRPGRPKVLLRHCFSISERAESDAYLLFAMLIVSVACITWTSLCSSRSSVVSAACLSVAVVHSDGQKLTKRLLTNSLATFFKLDHKFN